MEESYLMSNFVLKPMVSLGGGALVALALLMSACQPQPATNTTNTNTTNSTTNINSSNTSNANAGTTSTSGASIETKEPDQYSATITMKVEATGNQNMSLPALSADFARNGANQRIAFKIGNDQVT